MTSKAARKPARTIDTVDFLRMVSRILNAAGARVADADEEELGELFRLEEQLSEILRQAVAGLRRSGATWEDIGRAAGTTRQGAQQRWGTSPAAHGAATGVAPGLGAGYRYGRTRDVVNPS